MKDLLKTVGEKMTTASEEIPSLAELSTWGEAFEIGAPIFISYFPKRLLNKKTVQELLEMDHKIRIYFPNRNFSDSYLMDADQISGYLKSGFSVTDSSIGPLIHRKSACRNPWFSLVKEIERQDPKFTKAYFGLLDYQDFTQTYPQYTSFAVFLDEEL